MKESSHFQGKTPLDHLVDARKKGSFFTQEAHGSELSGYLYAAVISTKEISALSLVILPLFAANLFPFYPGFIVLFLTYSLWRGAFSAIRGFAKLQRLHQLIAEEHWEITHHREQEKQELYELYRAKGFSGQILDEIITTLMSDDHRLLEVMLTEEIGLKPSYYEHPLKGALAAFVTSLIVPTCIGLVFRFFGPMGSVFCALFFLGFSSFSEAKKERTGWIGASVWLLSLGIFLYASSTFFLTFFVTEL